MNKVLSVFLTVAMLIGVFSMTVVASSDTCIKLTDTTGSKGYSAGSDAVNSYVIENDGVTLIFDVMLESVATPSSGHTSRLFAFTGANEYNYAGYDFTAGAFMAGSGSEWPTNDQTTTFSTYATKSYEWKAGQWYEIAYQYNGNEVVVYLDGMPMVSAEVGKDFSTEYIILYPQYCTVLIDNLRVCGKDYNVRDRYGDIYAATDFTGVTSLSNVSCWFFDSSGYSVDTNGRPMPEFGEMLPERTVAPSITGAYLKYAEAAGTGTAKTGIGFAAYNGFTVVQDIRIDRKSTILASFGVRFGNNFIAGYDFDSSSFLISQRSGYGFNTSSSYTYAKTEYTINLKETYEFAVRQNGNIVSVYLNGVLMVQAVNDDFAVGYDSVEMTNYRLGASIDNLVIAYPDYDVRERKGGAAADFTFDESADYINEKWGFAIGTGKTGYTMDAQIPKPAVTVANATAVDGKATVNISLSDCIGYSAFELQVNYPSGFSVSSATVSSDLKGASVISQSTKNPFVMTYVAPAGETVKSADVLSIVFNTPLTVGKHTVSVTVNPYIGDILGASISGSGIVTVSEASIPAGSPDGLSYDGETLSWNADENASAYEVYVMYEGDDYEEYVDYTDECEMYFDVLEYTYDDEGFIYVKVYALNENDDQISESELMTVVYENDGSVYGGLDVYADELYSRLVEYVESNNYSADDKITIKDYLFDVEYDFADITDYYELIACYEDYKALIEEIPVVSDVLLGDVDGDGTVQNADLALLLKCILSPKLEVSADADIDKDGNIDNTDVSELKIMLLRPF